MSDKFSIEKLRRLYGGSETILVADDKEDVREVTRGLLKALGYRVLIACDGREAQKLLIQEGGQVDLVLSDVEMPRLGGIALAAWMEEAFPKIKKLLMSGHDKDKFILEGKMSQATHFIMKPFNLPELAQKIRRLLDAK